ncbi:glycoside hydrolase [Coccomyxa subellipsoidea C-169]|uniref:Beta-amylase n=1 Tax=Coccomyxa subellipsoidea (strain C-169) TaxID=574566 RepID=I0Z554_COCSC|nr:glycoside hydrolase [Coccomyxa subellipsoidea C-169]EIE25773.1 glycoside hydrolase [Coccomyxa subellipsoidea C-169]|eukprot:XP_005650317.1 glycoside hydrolase [Coccomyxa subellipsoidea C-169]
MLGVVEGTKFHRVQEHASHCLVPSKEDIDRKLMMNGKAAHIDAPAEAVQSQSEDPALAAGPKDAAAARQTATASTSQPQNGESAADPEPPNGVPVFVMLPLDTVTSDGAFRYTASKWFTSALAGLKASGVHGMAIDVWWGAVERQPGRYDWSGYRQVIELIKSLGLKVQAVMSFHACGGNVGDSAQVPLPKWVLKAGDQDPDIFFTDRPREAKLGSRNKEYVSIFADEAPRVLCGRSPVECYGDFMHAFREAFFDDVGSTIEEIVVGTGACGELRYPSYVEANGWRFPGIGEFQCYDRRALASLASAAHEAGHPEWGYTGPHDAGTYTSTPEETGFFRGMGGSWDTPYGAFFLAWYSGALLAHGERLVKVATSVAPERPAGLPVEVSLKIAGIHWWYRTRSHAAELTAGYYNTANRDGYNALVEICAEHGAALTLTCVEMCDAQHPPVALCGPEGLLRQVREAAAAAGVSLGGENALPCFSPGHVDALPMMRSFTFLRLTPEMLKPSYQATWTRFMHRMRNNRARGPSPTARTSTGLQPITRKCAPGTEIFMCMSLMAVLHS